MLDCRETRFHTAADYFAHLIVHRLDFKSARHETARLGKETTGLSKLHNLLYKRKSEQENCTKRIGNVKLG